MLPTTVMKFGGAGLSTGPAVRHVCEIIARAEPSPVVVVSAHEGVTAQLETCAREASRGRLDTDALRIRHRGLLAEFGLDPELLDRLFFELRQVLVGIRHKGVLLAEELDLVLSFGERLSARLVAAALRSLDHEATPVDAFDLGLTTDSCHGRARPLPGVEASLRESLRGIPGVPIVTGFLAKDDRGNLTTMGRNGSDLTASLLAKAAGVERVVFYKSVPGILSADPRVVPGARRIEELSLTEAAELALHGAEVLHPRALEPLLPGETEVEVRHIDRPDEVGTCIRGVGVRSRPLAVTGCAQLEGLRVDSSEGGSLKALHALLHAHHVLPRVLSTSAQGVSVWAPRGTGLEAVGLELASRATALEPLASAAIVGGGQDVAQRALAALEREGVQSRFAVLGAERASQLVLVPPGQGAAAMRALHEALLDPSRV